MNASVTTLAGLKRGDLLDQPGVSVRAQIEQARSKQARSGSPYLEWVLRDSEESMPLRIWDNHPQFTAAGQARSGGFVEVTALWSATERYGLEPKDWQFRLLQPDEIETLLAGSGESAGRQQADWDDIAALVNGMADARLRLLSRQFLEQFGERFRRAAGAREYHHARRGGLVEHVAQMMRCADAVSRVYQGLNRDLLLTGALFHDCGKLWENCYRERDFTMPYSEPAELLGHITLGIDQHDLARPARLAGRRRLAGAGAAQRPCPPASFAPDRLAPRRARLRLTRAAEDSGGHGAALHRQPRRQDRDVPPRL